MSAPETNLARQKKRHWAPLLGMGLVAVLGVILILIYWPAEEAVQSDGPDGAATQVDGRTGEPTNGGQFNTAPDTTGDGVVVPPPSEPEAPVVDPALDPLVEDPVEPGEPQTAPEATPAPNAVDNTDPPQPTQ